MPSGTISEVPPIEWKLLVGESFPVESPVFTSLGCSWKLQIRCVLFDNVDICLRRSDPNAGFISKNAVAVLGIREPDGTLIESESFPCPKFVSPPVTLKTLNRTLWPNVTLIVTCRFACGTPTPEEVGPIPSAIDTPQMKLAELEDLSSDFKDLLNSGRKCDATVNVQGKEFRVHRAVLSARSSVFRAMYEHDTSENETGYLTIPDCDPESFADFLNYIYSGKLYEISFRTAYNLYATAEKYDVQKLKSFCAGQVRRKMTMENLSDVIVLADKFGDDALMSSSADYARRNLTVDNVCQVILLADRYGDDVLMSSAREFFNKNFFRIFQTPEWKAMLRNNVRLVDMLLSGLDPAAPKNP